MIKIALSLAVFHQSALASLGEIDPTYSTGTLTDSINVSAIQAITLQEDGKIVVAGLSNGEWKIARYLPSGLPDNTFSDDGWTSIRPSITGAEGKIAGLAIQSDGKILIGGSVIRDRDNSMTRDFCLARMTANGSLDSSFSSDGIVMTAYRDDQNQHAYAQSLTIQPDGRILLAGSMVVRYLPDGTLDSSFDGDGRLLLGANSISNSIVLQPDGKIVLAGRDYVGVWTFRVRRLTATGILDSTFSGDGVVDWYEGNQLPEAFSATVDSNGRITVAGRITRGSSTEYLRDFAVMRLLGSGVYDPEFSGDGKLIIPIGASSSSANDAGPWHIIRPDGKIMLIGWHAETASICFARVNSSGEMDLSVGEHGVKLLGISGSVPCIAQQSDGKIVTSTGYGGVLPVIRLLGDLDTDGDGMDDPTEMAKGTNPNDRDTDDDGLQDGPEVVIYGTNPLLPDTDGDGLLDGIEVSNYRSNPLTSDSDSDGIGDFIELTTYYTDPARADSDGDGLTDPQEIQIHLTNPNISDTDSDGLSDGAEVNTHHTNPLASDTDGDGFLDGYEVLTGKIPLDPLVNPALVAEARTAIEFTFPAAIGKTYRIEASTDLVKWSTVESDIIGQGIQVQRFYSILGHQKRYFRVEEVGQ